MWVLYDQLNGLYNSLTWHVKKPNATWRMTVDYRELNKVEPPLCAIVFNIMSLVHLHWGSLGTYHYVLDLANTFFGIPIAPESQEQFAFI